jgi:hypothetical protein
MRQSIAINGHIDLYAIPVDASGIEGNRSSNTYIKLPPDGSDINISVTLGN